MSLMMNTKHFFDSIQESAESGKISIEKKCPFCGSEINSEFLKGIKVRIGRLLFLLRAIERGSDTAKDTLYNIFVNREYHGGFDIPEDSPKWWLDLVRKIDNETGIPII